MAKVELKNDFHGTKTTIRAEVLSHIHHTAEVAPTARQLARARKALCGIQGCDCGGIRGPQEFGGKRLIVDCSNEF
jgi:hypothetical protein